MSRAHHTFTALIASLMASSAVPALAQDAVDAADGGDGNAAPVGDIIVTAERRASNLQETPLAVTAVSGETLQAAGAAVINDLAASVMLAPVRRFINRLIEVGQGIVKSA